jgi:hypothetical protein
MTKKADAPKVKGAQQTKSALVSSFMSHGKAYYVLRLSRDIGEALTVGDSYDVTVKAGVLTLKPGELVERHEAAPTRVESDELRTAAGGEGSLRVGARSLDPPPPDQSPPEAHGDPATGREVDGPDALGDAEPATRHGEALREAEPR